jgi:negative regulator of flagellin synthesis FlgM
MDQVPASSSTGRAARTELASFSVGQDGGGSNPAVDQASLSPTASLVAQALSGSDVRTEKVTALQQSIAAGSYNVPSSDVAGKLMGALLD